MPTGLIVEIEALGETHVRRRIMRIGERAAGSVEGVGLWMSVFEDLLLIERVQFLTQGKGRWEQLADSTVAEKTRKGESPWIERASEALFESLTQPGAGGQIHEKAANWMRFGSDIPYAAFQQTGTSKMPQRKLIDLSEVDKVAIVKKIQRFIMTGETAPIGV